VPHLEGVAEAELELPFRGVGVPLLVTLPNVLRLGSRLDIPIGVVHVVEASALKISAWFSWFRDNVEVLLERGIELWKPGP